MIDHKLLVISFSLLGIDNRSETLFQLDEMNQP